MTSSVRHRSCSFGPLLIHYDEPVLTPRPWTLLQSYRAAEICADAEPGSLLELCAGVGHIGLVALSLPTGTSCRSKPTRWPRSTHGRTPRTPVGRNEPSTQHPPSDGPTAGRAVRSGHR
jgi:hypothetical protein